MTARILISGGGIAGLTLGILLKRGGYDSFVIEREPQLRTEGYMMDFFGTGWDVAERMGLVPALRAIRYPIDRLEYVAADGAPFMTMPIARVRRALAGKYVYLRRQDLERILFDRARAEGVAIAFGRSIGALEDRGSEVGVTFTDGGTENFALVFGADGVHSDVRKLLFGEEARFERFLGYYVAAFHFARRGRAAERALKLFEETDRIAAFYPLDDERMDATYVFRHGKTDIPKARRLAFVRAQFKNAGWIANDILNDYPAGAPIYFDSMTQIVMPQWHKGRVALVGDACGCLTLLAGQGSHMAMAGAYVIARELARNGGGHRAAFAAYQARLEPAVEKKQAEAARLSRIFVPSERSRPWLRRLAIRAIFSPLGIALTLRAFGASSVLKGYS